MRWIVITLVILNAAYFGWEMLERGQPATASAQQAALPPLKGTKLMLLTERLPARHSSAPPPAPQVAGDTTPVHRPVEKVDAKKEDMCVSIGPYGSEADGVVLVKNLGIEGVQSHLDTIQLSREVQYWVLVPPAKDRKAALQTLRKLQAKRIDSYLVSSGTMENAISLGLFNRQESAKGILADVSGAGFTAKIYEKERTENEYWVRLAPGQTLENLQETLETLVVPGGQIKISSASCEMFAQTK